MDQRIVLLEQGIAHGDGDFRAEPRRQAARSLGKLLRSHVVGRRVDEIASKENRFGDARCFFAIDAVGQDQHGTFPLVLPVAREFVCAQQPSKHSVSATDAFRNVVEFPDALGQAFGERGQCERIAAFAQSEHGASHLAAGRGYQSNLTFLRCEACAHKPRRFAFGAARKPLLQIAFCERVQRHGTDCACYKARMHG